ncbi:MAG TPA: Fic family protein [Acidobacteriaceae bacterium]
MARRIPEESLLAILAIVRRHSEGASRADIAEALMPKLPPRTLQFRLKSLVDAGRLATRGQGRAARYSLPETQQGPATVPTARTDAEETVVPLSPASAAIRRYLRQPVAARKPVGYNRQFLDSYRPNVSFYLTPAERAKLADTRRPNFAAEAAGTYAKQILNRLLIDLSWNSSRLEGNTYSLLDTKRLIEFGEEARGRDRLEAQMIVNHKDAIEFLVSAADEIGFNRYTILNLHGILAQNLLPDEGAAGRLRNIAVGIEKSIFHPLAVPQLIEECFNQILATAAAIEDPFEQAFFIMVQLPYLQPFDDVNKRVSRLAANIPFIRHNLFPLSFIDIPRPLYTDAILGVYELNEVDLLKDMFLWAYGRSAEQYAAVRQSLGEPDPFRFRHSAALRQIVYKVVRGLMDRRTATAYITLWAGENIVEGERERFRDMAETELLNLHEGNFARYQIRPSEFAAWESLWAAKAMG